MYILTTDYLSVDAPKVFAESLRKTGFGVLKNHPIDMQLVADVFDEWRQFFASPEKQNYLPPKGSQAGYFPPEISETAKGFEEKDIKEFFQIYPHVPLPPMVSDKSRKLYDAMNKLAITLLSWIEQQTPQEITDKLSMPLSEMIADSDMTMLRVLHYPPFQGDEPQGAVRAAAHEDINLITILPAATAPGLQAKDARGNWHDISCEPGTLVINTGDMLQEATGGYYPSTTHQVINPTGNSAKTSRMSMPLFLHPRPDVVLSERHTADSYLIERMKELGWL